jgi:hypothetical protein
MSEFRNMPYYVPRRKDYFKLKVRPIIDPRKDFTINGANVLDVDINNDTVVVDSAVTEPLIAVNKNNPADRVNLTLISTETLPQRDFTTGVKSPIEREPVLPLIKNNVDDIISDSFKSAKKGIDDVNDETDGEFEEPEEEDSDEIEIIKAKEKGKGIQFLLDLLTGG